MELTFVLFVSSVLNIVYSTIALFAVAPMFLKKGWPRSVKIGQAFERLDMPMPLMDEWMLKDTILCVIFILTPFNIEKVQGKFVSACLHNFCTAFIWRP